MSKVRYKTFCSRFDVHLKLDGGKKLILEFKGKDVFTKERYLDVDDEEIQNALESIPAFGIYFNRSSEFDWMKKSVVEPEEAQLEEIKPTEILSKEFTTVGEAKTWINKNHNIPFNRLTNLASIEKEYESLNFKLSITQKK